MKPKAIRGKPIVPNAGIKRKYQRELRKIVRRAILLTRILLTRLVPELRADAAQDSAIDDLQMGLFEVKSTVDDFVNEFASEYLTSIFMDIDKNSTSIIAQQLAAMIGTSEEALSISLPMSVNMDTLKAWIFENVSLIKKITDNYFTQITTDVTQIFTSGISKKELSKRIADIGQTSLRRADLIAEDQISKAYMSLNLQKFKDSGIEKFEWVHTHGGLNPRKYHKDVLNGQIFDINKPPVIDQRTGEKGYPGQAPFCRCVMRPVLYEENKQN